MTDAPNMTAAEEIAETVVSKLCNKDSTWPCVCAWHKEECEIIPEIAAIFTRHTKAREDELQAQLANAEKALKVAAKWAANSEPRECPWSMNYGCQGDVPCPNLRPRENQAAKCWLEYWKKEADREAARP